MDIVVCDDHPVVREGLTRMILATLQVESVREASDAQTLLDLLSVRACDVLLLDIGLPGRGGLDVLRQIRQERPRLPVLMLSVHPPDQYAIRALRLGAAGYLTKTLAAEELIKAIRTVTAGHRYLTSEVAEQLADVLDGHDHPPHETLSDREFEVFCLLAEGKSARQIADQIFLSYNTVSTYRTRILHKLGLKTNAEVVRYALQHAVAP